VLESKTADGEETKMPKTNSTTIDSPAPDALPKVPRGQSDRVSASNPVLDFQRNAGNQSVLRLLHSGALQAKLRVSQPGDADEVEADRVASQIVANSSPGTIHRKCACSGGGGSCPKCEEEELKGIHRKASNSASAQSRSADVLLNNLGSGQPLSSEIREPLEAEFGQDFGDVKIHTNSNAAASARSVNARAFTFGKNVVFNEGEYSPHTQNGKQLLAHELVHVVQQNKTRHSKRIQRVGLIEGVARLFGGGSFSEEELQLYLAFLDKNDHFEDHYDSDNKAREIVRRWQRGDPGYILTPRRKTLLIQEMLTGYTSNADELGILALLSGSGASEFNSLVDAVGETQLKSNFSGKNRKTLDAMLDSSRRKRPAKPGAEAEDGSPGEKKRTFSPETILEAEKLFKSNAEMGHSVRRNCIEIVRTMTPQLFAQDPQLAEQIRRTLGQLKGTTLTMPDAGRVLADLGVASGPIEVPFNNGNGNAEPTAMTASAWDTIVAAAGKTDGWQIFGMAVFDGYHSVTVFVDNRPDGPRVYWADQWAIEAGEEKAFHQEPSSVSGFRRYEKVGFDKFIAEKTRQWWNEVHSPDSKCGQKHPKTWDRSCRYTATLKIWHLKSGR